MRTQPRLATATLILCCTALLAGCGGNPTPKALPSSTPSPSATPTPSPTPTPPVMPAAAKQKTKAGAIAMARHFIGAVDYSAAAGDTAPLRASFTTLCTRCEALADGIERTYRAGGYFKGGEWTPTAFRFYAIKGDVAFVDVLVDYSAQEWLPKTGAKVTTFPASTRNLKALNLRWMGEEGWRVSALDPNK